MERRISAEPFPPGEYIAEMMEGKGWTQDDLAAVLRRSRAHINRLLGGKTAITADTAHELAQAFGTSPELWINLQSSYELALAAQKERGIERRAILYSKVPVRELIKRCWIRSADSDQETEREVCRLLGIESLEDQPELAVAARKSGNYEEPASPAQVAWFCRARQLAHCVQAATFTQERFEEGLKGLLQLAAQVEGVRQVPRTLAEMGVRFVLLEHLHGSLVDGAAFWIDNGPAVAISTRYNRIDNFWHTLIHELIHVKYRDKSPIDVDMESPQAAESEIEMRANCEAAEYLVPREKLESFIRRTKPLYYQTKIVQFAQARGVHPGIVVGQLQRRGELNYQQLRKLLVPIRETLMGCGLTDGWGNCPQIL